MNNKHSSYKRRKRTCFFTEHKIELIDYKEPEGFAKFINKNKKIISSKVTKTKPRFQKKLAKAIKRARYMALIPYTPNQE